MVNEMITIEGIDFHIVNANQNYHPGKVFLVNREIKDNPRYVRCKDSCSAVHTLEYFQEMIDKNDYHIS